MWKGAWRVSARIRLDERIPTLAYLPTRLVGQTNARECESACTDRARTTPTRELHLIVWGARRLAAPHPLKLEARSPPDICKTNWIARVTTRNENRQNHIFTVPYGSLIRCQQTEIYK